MDSPHQVGPASSPHPSTALESVRGLPVEEISPAIFALPTLSFKLLSLQQSLEHGSGAAMLRGLPIERYSEEQAARLFWGLTSYVGSAVSQSPAGERVFAGSYRATAAGALRGGMRPV